MSPLKLGMAGQTRVNDRLQWSNDRKLALGAGPVSACVPLVTFGGTESLSLGTVQPAALE